MKTYSLLVKNIGIDPDLGKARYLCTLKTIANKEHYTTREGRGGHTREKFFPLSSAPGQDLQVKMVFSGCFRPMTLFATV